MSYYGESSRSAYERGKEHFSDYDKVSTSSHMLKHHIMVHKDVEGKLPFSLKILRCHQTAFSRQVHEAVVIQRNKAYSIMNSKGEYSRCRLPRLKVMLGKKDTEKEEEELTEAEIEAEIRRMGWRKRTRKKVEKEKEGVGGNEIQEPPLKRKRRWKVNYAVKRKEQDVTSEENVRNVDHYQYKRRKIEEKPEKRNVVQTIQEGRHQPSSSTNKPRNKCNTVIFENFKQINENSTLNDQDVQHKNEFEENIQTKKVYPIFTAQFKPQGKKKIFQLKTKANPAQGQATHHYHPPKRIRTHQKTQLGPSFKFKRLEEYFYNGTSGNTN